MTLVKRWWLPTILVILGMIGLARLGVWQLDRLQQKRDYNTLMAERWRQAPGCTPTVASTGCSPRGAVRAASSGATWP